VDTSKPVDPPHDRGGVGALTEIDHRGVQLGPHRGGKVVDRRDRRRRVRRRGRRRTGREGPRRATHRGQQIDRRAAAVARVAVEQRLDDRGRHDAARRRRRLDRRALGLGHQRERAPRARDAGLAEAAGQRTLDPLADRRRHGHRRAAAPAGDQLAAQLVTELRRRASPRIEVRADRVTDLLGVVLVRQRPREHAPERGQLARDRGGRSALRWSGSPSGCGWSRSRHHQPRRAPRLSA
jgi:hypothetical protein